MKSWKVGAIEIVRIEEAVGPSAFAPEKFFVGLDPAELPQYLSRMPGFYAADKHRFVSSMHSWLVRTPKQVMLVDCCCGNHKNRPWMPAFHQLNSRYLDNLRAAGVEPEDVNVVVCTHLHVDHIGWNTRLQDGKWVPTFPNARYLFTDRDDARWNPVRNPATDPNRAESYRDSVGPVIAAGQAVLLPDGPHVIEEGIVIEPSPGHTPGHVSLRLSNGGKHGFIPGDVLHSPLQVFLPHLNSFACEDPEQARATRRRVLEFCADNDALIFPGHFAPPHAARIRRDRSGFDIELVAAT